MPARRKREQAVLAAFWMHLGQSAEEAAAKVEVAPRTVYRWQRRPDWATIKAEAHVRWLTELAMAARGGLLEGVKKDGRLALSTLERIETELAPAPQAVELRALLQRLDPSTLPDEVVAQLADNKNVLGVLLGMLGAAAPMAGLLPAGHDGEIVVDPERVPEAPE